MSTIFLGGMISRFLCSSVMSSYTTVVSRFLCQVVSTFLHNTVSSILGKVTPSAGTLRALYHVVNISGCFRR